MGVDDEQREKRTRLDAIWFRADAWEETRKFYREVLGLKEVHVDQEGGEAAFSTDAGPAVFLVRGGLAGQSRGAPMVGLRFPELETLRDQLVEAGVQVEVRRGEPGITRLIFSDPEGHRFAAFRWEIKDAVKPITVRGVATDDANGVLMVRVERLWTLPGGVVDDNESPLETLEREFLEEVRVRPVDPQLSGVYHNLPWDGLALFFHCRVDGEPRPGAEVSACEFVDLKRVAELATPWGLDRVLDVFEFPGRAVARSQRTDSPKNYVPVRRGPR